MEYVTVQIPAVAMQVESRGVVVNVPVGDIPVTLLATAALHGIKQKIGDAASQAAAEAWKAVKGENAPKPTRDALREFVEGAGKAKTEEYTRAAMEKARDAILAGKWMIREGGGTSTKWNETESVALGMAKDVLTGIFKTACAAKGIKGTFDNFTKLGDAVAKYFNTEGKRPVWNDEPVMAWIKAQKDGGKADYLAAAAEEIARRESLVADVDVSELLDGI